MVQNSRLPLDIFRSGLCVCHLFCLPPHHFDCLWRRSHRLDQLLYNNRLYTKFSNNHTPLLAHLLVQCCALRGHFHACLFEKTTLCSHYNHLRTYVHEVYVVTPVPTVVDHIRGCMTESQYDWGFQNGTVHHALPCQIWNLLCLPEIKKIYHISWWIAFNINSVKAIDQSQTHWHWKQKLVKRKTDYVVESCLDPSCSVWTWRFNLYLSTTLLVTQETYSTVKYSATKYTNRKFYILNVPFKCIL